MKEEIRKEEIRKEEIRTVPESEKTVETCSKNRENGKGYSCSQGRGKMCSKEVKSFLQDESGVGVIEIVLILVVLIGLVIIFKNQINKLLDTIFKQINNQSKEVYS